MASHRKIDVDEAVRKKDIFGSTDEELYKKIEEAQDDKFTDIYSLTFGWREQVGKDKEKTGEAKLMSMLPNGKITFVDRNQDENKIVPEDPYICLVFEPSSIDGYPGKVAFAKVLFPEYQPKIYIPASRLPAMVWRDEKGRTRNKVPVAKSYRDRLFLAIQEMESMGYESIKLVFRKNMRN